MPISSIFAILTTVAAGINIQEYTVSGYSMAPLLMNGATVRITNVPSLQIGRGDIIVFRVGEKTLVKKVVGLPGDSLDIHSCNIENLIGRNCVYINEQVALSASSEPYTLQLEQGRFLSMYAGKLNGYLVLGAVNSYDSSKFGPVPPASIIGRVTEIQNKKGPED